MVEIRRLDLPESAEPRNKAAEDDDKYRLVYSKSKVYVNPTAYAKDNIPGFVALVKRVSPWIMTVIVNLTDLHLGSVKSYIFARMDPRKSSQ